MGRDVTKKTQPDRLARLLHHLRLLLAPAPPGAGPIRLEAWNDPAAWTDDQREAYDALKREAWTAADEHGHRWFQVMSSPGWVTEICGVGGCATKRQRSTEASAWELRCGLCDRVLEGRPAGPCDTCLGAEADPRA